MELIMDENEQNAPIGTLMEMDPTTEWYTRFAWLPVQTQAGNWVWFDPYIVKDKWEKL